MVRIPGTRLVQLINVLTAPDLSRFLFVCIPSVTSRSTIGGGGNNFVPVSGGEGTKIVPLGDLFEQPPSEMNLSSGKLADHAGDHVVLSPERVVFVPSPGAKSLYPRPPPPPHLLEHSYLLLRQEQLLYTQLYFDSGGFCYPCWSSAQGGHGLRRPAFHRRAGYRAKRRSGNEVCLPGLWCQLRPTEHWWNRLSSDRARCSPCRKYARGLIGDVRVC